MNTTATKTEERTEDEGTLKSEARKLREQEQALEHSIAKEEAKFKAAMKPQRDDLLKIKAELRSVTSKLVTIEINKKV